MRLPAFESIVEGLARVLRRFSFSMLAAFIGTISAYAIIHFESLKDEWSLYRLLMTSVLGFLLFGVIQLKLEREKFRKVKEHMIKAAGALFLVLYYWLLPNDFDFAAASFVIRFFLLGLALLFSLSFVPFIRHLKEVNGFWQYNKILFIRFFFTFVFTGTLYLGLVLALVGIKQLLGVDFDEKLFLEMWVVIVGLIATSFFLAGVPEKTSALEKKIDYHKGIRIFAQYILIPLILIYAVILYIYTGKIIIHWDWPEGMVSWLIIVFSLATILANFMLHPLHLKEKWINYFTRLSYILIIPMTLVMFLAFKIRIDEYGITEPRYYGVLLCLWLLLTALYFVFSKKKNLICLPVSLFVITIISSAGPISSMSVSKWSQLGRLESALIRNEVLVGGKIQKTGKEVSKEDLLIIGGGIEYIKRVHGYAAIQPWFDDNLDAYDERVDCYGPDCVMQLMGLEYISPWEFSSPELAGTKESYQSFVARQSEPLSIEGFKKMSEFYLSGPEGYSSSSEKVLLNMRSMTITYEDGEIRSVISIKWLIDELIKSGISERSWDAMRIDNDEIGLVFRNINLRMNDEGEIEEVLGMDGYLLIK